MHSLTLRWADQDHPLIDRILTDTIAAIQAEGQRVRAESRTDRRTGALELWIGRCTPPADHGHQAAQAQASDTRRSAQRPRWPEDRPLPLRLISRRSV